MAARNSHTPGRSTFHVECPRHDELPDGVPAPSGALRPPVPVVARRPDGQLADSQAASELGRLGGLAKAASKRKLRALATLGLRHVGGDLTVLAPFLVDAEAFAEHEVERLARECGGGHVGAGPCSMVHSASLQLAMSRFLYSTGDASHIALASRLSNDSRQNLAMAFEMVVREAKSRPRDPMADLDRRMGIEP